MNEPPFLIPRTQLHTTLHLTKKRLHVTLEKENEKKSSFYGLQWNYFGVGSRTKPPPGLFKTLNPTNEQWPRRNPSTHGCLIWRLLILYIDHACNILLFIYLIYFGWVIAVGVNISYSWGMFEISIFQPRI